MHMGCFHRSVRSVLALGGGLVLVAIGFSQQACAQTNGIVTFAQTNYSVNASQSNAVITVVDTGSNDGTGTVQFATFDGTATAGVDYVSTTGTVTFPPGVLTNTISIPLLSDPAAPATQTVQLVLSDPIFALIGNPSIAVLRIFNVQTQVVQFVRAAFTVNEGDSNAVITVVRTGETNAAATVGFGTGNGSAHAGVDYTSTNGVVIFAPGVLTNTFVIPILESGLQTNKTIDLTLSNPSNDVVLGVQDTAVLTIVATGPTVVQFGAATYHVHEHVGKAKIAVLRFGDSSATSSVNYATSNGTALSGSDYLGTSGTLIFAPGVSSQSFSFQFVEFRAFQSNKTVNLTLSTPLGASLGTQDTAVVTIINDKTQTISFTNANTDLVTITLQSAGQMEASPTSTPLNIAMSGIDSTTTLSVKVKKGKTGTGLVQVGSITGDGDIASISAPGVDLASNGVVQVNGFLRSLSLHDIFNGGTVTVRGVSSQNMTIVAHDIQDGTTADVGSRIKTLTAARFGVGTIIAPSIGTMSIKGDKRNGIPGDCAALIVISGGSNQTALGSLAVSGSLSNAAVDVANGSVGSVSAVTMIDSLVYVGYAPTNTNAPLSGGAFVPDLRLGSVSVKSSSNGFINSYLAAAEMGKISLGSVQTNNVAVPFGVIATQSISSVSVKVPKFKWSPSGANDQPLGDFHVIH